MAGELKGDRDYHGALRRLGIKNPGEILHGHPNQFVTVLDDVAHLQPPIEVAIEGIGRQEPADAARTSIPIELEVVGGPLVRGVWLLWLGSANQDTIIGISPTQVLTNDIVEIVPGFNVSPGIANSSLVWRTGTTTAALTSGVGADFRKGLFMQIGSFWSTPIFVPPTNFIYIGGLAANITINAGMVVQVVPGVGIQGP